MLMQPSNNQVTSSNETSKQLRISYPTTYMWRQMNRYLMIRKMSNFNHASWYQPVSSFPYHTTTWSWWLLFSAVPHCCYHIIHITSSINIKTHILSAPACFCLCSSTSYLVIIIIHQHTINHHSFPGACPHDHDHHPNDPIFHSPLHHFFMFFWSSFSVYWWRKFYILWRECFWGT